MLELKRTDNTTIVKLDIPIGTLVHRELMSDHYIKIPFSLDEPMYLRLGDWCKIDGFGRFELTELYSPKYNSETGGYDYNLQLDAYYIKWKNKKCKYLPENAASETSFNLTAPIGTHLNVIVNGINAIGSKDSTFRYEGQLFEWKLVNFPTDVNAAKHKQYNNTDFISALNDLASIWECEWWVDTKYICFGRLEVEGEEIPFTLDTNVVEMSSSNSKKEYATRIYAFGSEKNLPSDYRKDSSADITINGIVQKRLMLPLSLCPNGYVQDANIYNEVEAVEAIFIDEDIYPKVECVISKIEKYTDTYIDEETKEEITQTFYRLYDKSGFNFSTDMILENNTLRLKFQSGKMNGMDFECRFNDEKKYYEVIVNEDYGRPLPDESLHPEVDDIFVPYNWDSSKLSNTGIIEKAEKELYDAVLLKLDHLKIDPNTYTCKMMSNVYEEEMRIADDTYAHYDMGQKVFLNNPTYFRNGRSSRIIGYEIKLDIPYDTPEYIVGEATAYSRNKDMQEKLQSLTLNGQSYQSNGSGGNGVYIITSTSTTSSSDTNVYSAKRSDKQFARKDISDTFQGQMTHKQRSIHEEGTQFGKSFVPGLVGVGGMIDGKGNAELRSLKLWEWLEVPEFRYNRVSVNIGLQMNTCGGGVIESVVHDSNGGDTGYITLKLEDGEYGAIENDDFIMGIWHDTDSGNAEENADDRKGSFSFRGFKTIYFMVADIPTTDANGNDNRDQHYFAYKLRGTTEGGNGIHPYAGMHFACRGNATNKKRQSFSYYSPIESYALSLTGVNTWEFDTSNYYEIRGKLDGFTMPAINSNGDTYTKTFSGYGQVFGNAYIFGHIDTFERVAYRCIIHQSLGGSLAPNETEDVSVQILNGYGTDVTERFTLISVTRDSGDEASDILWNAEHVNVGNTFKISFSDLNIDGIRKLVTVFYVTATDEVSNVQTTATLEII